MSQSVYMHTINGEPAEYRDHQICYAVREVTRLASSLRQIRDEQIRSLRWRIAQGYPTERTEYGYVRIKQSAFNDLES